ncbi:MAG: TonB-dependent receptor [Nitrospinota bacterium]|nr:TonB-dependent receptor [Nitrospinota bacterium]
MGFRKSIALFFFFFIPGFVTYGTVYAQELNTKVEILLDPVTATATRTPRKLSTIADSIEIIPKREMDFHIPNDFEDLMRDSIGGIVEKSGSRGGRTNFRIRGSETNFTSILLDGFKITPPDGDPFLFEHISPEWIRNAEILKGPQSTLYGSDAAAGAINLLVDMGSPGEEISKIWGIRYGSQETIQEFMKIKGGTDKTGFLFTVSRTDTDGRFYNDGYYRTVGTMGFDFYPTQFSKVRFLYQHNKNQIDNTSNDGATNTELRLTGPYTDRELNNFTRTIDNFFGIRAETEISKNIDYISKISFYRSDSLYLDQIDALDAVRAFFSPYMTDTTLTSFRLDNQLNFKYKSLRPKKDLLTSAITTLGFEFEKERTFQVQISSTERSKRTARSFYAQEQLTFWDRFYLTTGFRFDDFVKGKDPATYKISSAYYFKERGTRIRSVYGKGVKRPSFTDIFGTQSYVGNPNLDPEVQKSWEFGIDQEFLGKLVKASATYYHNELKNIIAWSWTAYENGTNYENITKARTKGAEFSISILNYNDFTIRANYNTLDTIVLDDSNGLGGSSFKQGQELVRRPNWWWSSSISYHPKPFIATVNINQMSSRRDFDYRGFVDGTNGGSSTRINNAGFTKIDVAISYYLKKLPLSDQKTTLEFKVNNLLDEDYDEVFGYNAPGIEIYAGMSTSF